MYFDFFLPKVTISYEISLMMTQVRQQTIKAPEPQASSHGGPDVCSVVVWRLRLVHPIRGEWPTVLPKLGKNTKI